MEVWTRMASLDSMNTVILDTATGYAVKLVMNYKGADYIFDFVKGSQREFKANDVVALAQPTAQQKASSVAQARKGWNFAACPPPPAEPDAVTTATTGK